MKTFPATPDPPVLFLAPGSGLGHLVRTGALALSLEKEGIPCVIVTSSAWARGFSRITGLGVILVPPNRWRADISELVAKIRPRVLVLDTFPLGFRGETLEGWNGCPVVYLARRLKFDAYVRAVRDGGTCPGNMTAIVIEDLEPGHRAWLEKNTGEQVYLSGRIRFPASLIEAPEIPKDLADLLDNEPVHLVVHSGPEHEVHHLIARAQKAIRTQGTGRLAVINPVLAGRDNAPGCFDYFPASLLYEKAYRIYSGAGYNAVAEGGGMTEKHRVVPFSRRYDDQFWRAQDAQTRTQPHARSNGLNRAVISRILFSGATIC